MLVTDGTTAIATAAASRPAKQPAAAGPVVEPATAGPAADPAPVRHRPVPPGTLAPALEQITDAGMAGVFTQVRDGRATWNGASGATGDFVVTALCGPAEARTTAAPAVRLPATPSPGTPAVVASLPAAARPPQD